MAGRYRSLMSFSGGVLLIIAALAVLHRIPPAVQTNTARSFPSIEAVQNELGMKDLPVPAYFPQEILWPPARILAQNAPYPATLMEFHRRESSETVLVIIRAADRDFARNDPLALQSIREQVNHTLKGHDALLTVGTCVNGKPCSRLAWKDKESYLFVTMRSTPFELIRIAESMVH